MDFDYTEVKRVKRTVSLTEKEVLDGLFVKWLSTKSCKDIFSTFTPAYVTKHGDEYVFERWVDSGHGSGVTYRQTLEKSDLKEYKAFVKLAEAFGVNIKNAAEE